ncbi:MAG: LPS export ABC transporter periplasmic protein LptC [Elusimicrobiaceae bacterium]|nr:LPS export ABC transporter periplasmic protein LptC [Elusimicrobiaceae bacterium]MBP5616452.1 LPS export ABC transporter periplasmic protein LptC [Elusimicrobiaceae bacterium]
MKYFAVLLVSILALAACSGSPSATSEDEDSQVATHVSIFSSKENQKQWVLQAVSVNFENMQNATLKEPRLVLKQDGKDSATVSGELGTFDYEKQLVSIEGNATLTSLTEKAVITASEFFYDIAKDKIWSSTKTTITRGTARSVAKNGIETDSKLTKIIIKKHATRLPENRSELQRSSL